ncbi:repeat element 7 protein [Diadegma fenestrale ichnovirus]|nr:repeat element 7 protein [Diadegma fenestrale ichnovirus]ULM71665.1 repeat element 7 protein [Diadegma fenestrale ichnovirus]
METSKNKVLRAPLALPRPPLEEEIFVPLDIILYLARFLKFEDYRNFVRSLWPANDECDIVQNKLWQLSTHKIAVTFLNGKSLKIEYNFDASRTKQHRILFNVETLMPVFGWVVPPGTQQFLSVPKLQNFIRMHVHLNMCSGRQYATCLCYQLKCSTYTGVPMVKPPEIACKYGHFHHYCSQHVMNWLNFYLTPNVLLREMPNLYDEDMAESLLLFISNTVHLNRR